MDEDSRDGHVSLLIGLSCFSSSLDATADVLKTSLSHQEDNQEDEHEHENMQDMDILDMNILDETDNDNGIPAEDDEYGSENFYREDDSGMNEENDYRALESEEDTRGPEVRDNTRNLSAKSLLVTLF